MKRGATRWGWLRPSQHVLPPHDQRAWVHPSEFGSFATMPTTPLLRIKGRNVSVLMLLFLAAGVLSLANAYSSSALEALPPKVVNSIAGLPSSARQAALHTVELRYATPGHEYTTTALVVSGDLAVTTTPIPSYALITAATPSNNSIGASFVGRDDDTSFSIVQLHHWVAPTMLAPLPINTDVTAFSPLSRTSVSAPRFTYALTALGSPFTDRQGVVTYFATRSESDVNSFRSGFAVNANGAVVAMLSTNHLWYPATFVEKIANLLADGRGCHARLGVLGTTQQGGGVRISALLPDSPSAQLLHAGDVITNFNGAQVPNWNALVSDLYLTPAFSEARVTFVGPNGTQTGDVPLLCAL